MRGTEPDQSARDLAGCGAIGIHDPDFHFAGPVALEGDLFAVRKPRGRLIEIRLIVSSQFPGIASRGIDDPDMRLVFLQPVDLSGELMPIGRPHRPLGVSGTGGKVTDLASPSAIGIHHINSQIALSIAATCKSNTLAIRRPVIVPCDG